MNNYLAIKRIQRLTQSTTQTNLERTVRMEKSEQMYTVWSDVRIVLGVTESWECRTYYWLLRVKGLDVRRLCMWLKGRERSLCCANVLCLNCVKANTTWSWDYTAHLQAIATGGKCGKDIHYLCVTLYTYIWIDMCLTVKILLQNGRLSIPYFHSLWNKVQYLS